MKLSAGGYLAFFLPDKRSSLVLDLATPTSLRSLLIKVGIPPEEVHLVIMNDIIVNLDEAVVENQDTVKVYSPIDGG